MSTSLIAEVHVGQVWRAIDASQDATLVVLGRIDQAGAWLVRAIPSGDACVVRTHELLADYTLGGIDHAVERRRSKH